MKQRKLVGFLSITPLLWVGIQMLVPSLPESKLIILLSITTFICFFIMYEEKEKSLGIGIMSAFLVFLIGADRVHDYFRYGHGTLDSMAEAAALLLCSVEYFHYFLRHSEQEKQIEDLQYYKKRCEVLEKKIRDQDTNQ